MNSDHFFTIGKPHVTQGTPCEDFALSGAIRQGLLFGVVADGCSGANANTDVGARALAYAFRKTLAQRDEREENWFGPGFVESLKESFIVNQFTGREQDFLATVVGMAATSQEAAAFVFGDGAIAVRYADGRRMLIECNWWDNTPFYLQYRNMAPSYVDEFSRLYGTGVLEPFSVKKTIFIQSQDGLKILDATTDRFSLDDVFDGFTLQFRPEHDGIEALAVLTDGISRLGQVPPEKVTDAFLAFKNYQGNFVKRRLIKALDTFAKKGDLPQDDIGMACIWFGEESRNEHD